MNKIETQILNPSAIDESEKMMVCAARLTQRGHQIKSLDDFMVLYDKDYTEKTVRTMAGLPHPTIQKFGVINVVITGASRRFLAQITRHQNEVKFMSASLQYSDYSGEADFVIPYAVLGKGPQEVEQYLLACQEAMDRYKTAVNLGLDNDAAGYMAPQGLRNILIMSATPYQWKHMISQRVCRRNTAETRYVMLKIWEQLNAASALFNNCGPFCMQSGGCKEGSMCCNNPIVLLHSPTDIIEKDFSLIKTSRGGNPL